MPNIYEIFRSNLAKEMREARKEKNKQLEELENSSLQEKIKGKNRKEIIKNFENNIGEIKNRHGYEETRKIHLEGIRKKLMKEESTYTNDGNPNYKKIPKEDAKIAAEAYGEGYKPLEDFLRICFENEIQTFGCCSGHPEIGGNTSYVYFDGRNDKVKKLIEFIIEENLADEIGMDIDDINGEKCLKIPVFLDTSRRDSFYKRCTEKLKEIIDLDYGEEKKENYITDKIERLLGQYDSGAQAILNISERKVTIYSDETKEYLIDDIE